MISIKLIWAVFNIAYFFISVELGAKSKTDLFHCKRCLTAYVVSSIIYELTI